MAFQDFLANLLSAEGGYSDHPKDRGGKTIRGVSSKYWPKEYSTLKNLVDTGKTKEADEFTGGFYKKNFWDAMDADNLAADIAPLAVDAAVNHGVGTAKRMLEESGGKADNFLNRRSNYVKQIVKNDPSQKVFAKGWNNRIENQRPQGVDIGGIPALPVDWASDEPIVATDPFADLVPAGAFLPQEIPPPDFVNEEPPAMFDTPVQNGGNQTDPFSDMISRYADSQPVMTDSLPGDNPFADLIPPAPMAAQPQPVSGADSAPNPFADLIPPKNTGAPVEAVSANPFADLIPAQPHEREQGALDKYLLNPLGRGFNNLQQSMSSLGFLTGMSKPEDFAQSLSRDEKDMASYPIAPDVAAQTKNIMDAKGFWGTVKSLATNPKGVVNATTESLASSLPSLVGGAVGGGAGLFAGPAAPVAVPVGRAAGAGLGSFASEYGSTFMDQLRASGIDPSNEAAVLAAVNNPEFIQATKDRAMKRAGVVGAFDALSGGLAGKIAGPVSKVGGKVAGGTAEIGAQAAAGAGGEAGAQLATDGKITSAGAIGLEAAGELLPGGIESAIGYAGNKAAEKKKDQPSQPAASPAQPPIQPPPPAAAQAQTAPPVTEPVQEPPAAAPPPAPAAAVRPVEPTPPAPAGYDPTKQRPSRRVVTPDNKIEIDTVEEVIDASKVISSDMSGYPKDHLQPRDRDRAASETWVQSTAGSLDPLQLGESRTTESGSPIIGSDDNFVESGNGRVMVIRRAYEQFPERAEAYRQQLIAAGHNIDGMAQPILVRRRVTKMTPQERTAFTMASNAPKTAVYSTTEKAKSDAVRIGEAVLLYKGGDVTSLSNSDFRRQFVNTIPTAERGAIVDADGNLSQEGRRRMEAMLMASAYDDPDITAAFTEDANPDVKSIGTALINVAGDMARLKQKAKAGSIPAGLDITKKIAAAVKAVRDARKNGTPISEVLTQQAMFAEQNLDPVTKKIIESFYQPGLKKLQSGAKIEQLLRKYVQEAEKAQPGDGLLGKETTPEEILKIATPVEDPAEQGKLMDQSTTDEDIDDDAPLQDTAATGPKVGSAEELTKTDGRTMQEFSHKPGLGDNHKIAFILAGLDPVKAALQPPEKQLSTLIDFAKRRFGLRIQRAPGVNARYAIDQIADIIVGLKNTADVIGLPSKFMGLDGQLGIRIVNNLRGALGVFDPNTNQISLPHRSNSASHEWLHALDFMLLRKIGGAGSMFSRDVRKDGGDYEVNVQHAFINLLNNVFFDKAQLAAEIIELEGVIASSKPESKVVAEAKRKLEEIKSGKFKGVNTKSKFYKSSKLYNEMTDSEPGYYTDPAEMLARSYEAYIAYKLEQKGLDASRISKSGLAYDSAADERLAKTFPKAMDRFHIFNAYDQFFTALSQAHQMNGEVEKDQFDMGPAEPDRVGRLLAEEGVPSGIVHKFVSFLRKEKQNLIDNSKDNKEAKDREKRQVKLGTGKHKSSFYESAARPLSEKAYRLVTLFPNSPSLKKVLHRFFTNPGSGIGGTGDTFTQAWSRKSAEWTAKVEKMADQWGYKTWSKTDKDELFRNMTGWGFSKGFKGDREKIELLADEMRMLYDDLWNEMNESGDTVNYYEKSAYIQMRPLVELILENPADFKADATEAYGVMFDHKFGSLENLEDLIVELKNLANSPALDIGKKEYKAMIQKLIPNNNMSEEDNAKAMAEALEMLKENLEKIREAFSVTAAEHWYARLTAGGDFQNDHAKNFQGFGAPTFAKERKFIPEAHQHLEKWLEKDVLKLATDYASETARRVASNNAVKPKDGETLADLFNKMKDEGVTDSAAKYLMGILEHVMGRNTRNPVDAAHSGALGYLHEASLYGRLTRAVIASLPEPGVATLISGNPTDALHIMFSILKKAAGTKDMQDVHDLLESFGLLNHGYNGGDFASRYGSGIDVGNRRAERINKYFGQIGVVGLTNLQRNWIAPTNFRYILRMARKINKSSGIRSNQALRDLADFTQIDKEELRKFSHWVVEKYSNGVLPLYDDAVWETPYGQILKRAIINTNEAVIANPNVTDKPWFATSSIGSALFYTAQTFNFSMFKNVHKRNWKRVGNAWKEDGLLATVEPLAQAAVIQWLSYAPAILVFQTAKLFFLDHEKWKELEDDDDLTKYLLLRMVEQMNIFGGVGSAVYNAAIGLTYGQALTTSMAGASYSMPADLFTRLFQVADGPERLLGLKSTNSDKNNTAEYNAVKSFYRNVVAPGVVAGISHLAPGGGLLGLAAGGVMAATTSGTAADAVTTALVGEKGKKEKGRR